MAKANFSETQFVFGYLSEMYRNHLLYKKSNTLWRTFMFPSPLVEKRFPVDFYARYPHSHSEFYQFKRSEHIKQRRGRREIEEGVPQSFLDYYRFKVYNKSNNGGKGQFEKLVELAHNRSKKNPNDLVCYCAPCFHTISEFHYYFRKHSIIQNSVIIDCHQFDHFNFRPPNFDINDGDNHYLVYKLGDKKGYMCSEPKVIKVQNADSLMEKSFNNDEYSFKETITTLYNEIYLEDEVVIEKERSDSINEQFIMVGRYLLQYYNILWIPKFRY